MPEGRLVRAQGVFLIGYRGSGKTSVGRRLAGRWGSAFVDTDRRIEELAQQTITSIFATLGEARFRELEEAAVAEVTARALAGECVVAATGGGVVLRSINVERLRASGQTVWLRASIEDLRARIAADPRSSRDRPALAGASAVDEVGALLAVRTPLYERAAQHVVDTSGLSIEDVVRRVEQAVGGGATVR